MEDSVTLTFTCPEPDFDGIDVEIALNWVNHKLAQCAYPQDETGGQKASRILRLILERYEAAIESAEQEG